MISFTELLPWKVFMWTHTIIQHFFYNSNTILFEYEKFTFVQI